MGKFKIVSEKSRRGEKLIWFLSIHETNAYWHCDNSIHLFKTKNDALHFAKKQQGFGVIIIDWVVAEKSKYLEYKKITKDTKRIIDYRSA